MNFKVSYFCCVHKVNQTEVFEEIPGQFSQDVLEFLYFFTILDKCLPCPEKICFFGKFSIKGKPVREFFDLLLIIFKKFVLETLLEMRFILDVSDESGTKVFKDIFVFTLSVLVISTSFLSDSFYCFAHESNFWLFTFFWIIIIIIIIILIIIIGTGIFNFLIIFLLNEKSWLLRFRLLLLVHLRLLYGLQKVEVEAPFI